MIRRIRIWWHAKWFAKHWQVSPGSARHYATIYVNAVDERRAGI